ncbi:MAG TPA: DUF3857 domain-containing protein [Thermoanaerobaculia bacterium]|nr:DUF3857 domain-containing protein [Thermoanaerobaculia bacterium]
MRSRCFWSAASLAALCAAPLPAATILERSIDVEVRPDGTVSERERLRVRLDDPGDLSSWSRYPVYFDEHREIVSLSASATRPDGKTVQVPRKDLDTVEFAGSGELHSSRKFRVVTFPAVPVGSVLALDFEARERPYFPAGAVDLGGSDPIESLRVLVRAPGLRWRMDGALPGVEARDTEGGVLVTGARVPRTESPDYAPENTGALLRYTWGDAKDWEAVGRWYEGLLAQVPRNAEPVRRKARELTAGVADPREKILKLLDFARRQVRYVAVEVGIGGYRPSPPQQVMERLWGDCKDKALLLVDLLREVGIEAYPVLILADLGGRVDREIPSPGQFNHAIAAVPADGLGLPDDAPVAGGYLFLDATQTLGGLAWLQPADQGQEALIVRGGRGILVTTPVRPQLEGKSLKVELDLAASGEATGQAHLELSGGSGSYFLSFLDGSRPQEADRVAREVFSSFLPAGAVFESITWKENRAGLPSAMLEARVKIPATSLPQEGALPAIPLPSMTELPAPGLLDGRTLPVAAAPFASRLDWKVTLPRDACTAEGQDIAVDNDVSGFHQKIAVNGKVLTIERRSDLKRRWIDPASFPALKEAALAEHRTNKRRLRVSCR